MSEKIILEFKRPLKYKGLFDFSELYKVIDSWLAQNHYDKIEHKNFEEVFEDHKQITLELVPYKKLSDYAKAEIKIIGEFTNLTEEVVERNGLKQKIFKGEILFLFDSFLITDYEAHWETKPVYFFFRTIVDKFLYKSYTSRFENEVKAHVNELFLEIKNYLNMQRYR